MVEILKLLLIVITRISGILVQDLGFCVSSKLMRLIFSTFFLGNAFSLPGELLLPLTSVFYAIAEFILIWGEGPASIFLMFLSISSSSVFVVYGRALDRSIIKSLKVSTSWATIRSFISSPRSRSIDARKSTTISALDCLSSSRVAFTISSNFTNS